MMYLIQSRWQCTILPQVTSWWSSDVRLLHTKIKDQTQGQPICSNFDWYTMGISYKSLVFSGIYNCLYMYPCVYTNTPRYSTRECCTPILYHVTMGRLGVIQLSTQWFSCNLIGSIFSGMVYFLMYMYNSHKIAHYQNFKDKLWHYYLNFIYHLTFEVILGQSWCVMTSSYFPYGGTLIVFSVFLISPLIPLN